MKLIYACYGGAHSSPVAAAIHLGWLAEEQRPTPADILALPRFDRTSPKDLGVPELLGHDEFGNEVYVMGRGPGKEVVERALQSGFSLAGGERSQLIVVSTLGCVNLAMRVGGFMSRVLGWTFVGRPLVLWGTCRAFADLVGVVQRTKRFLEEQEARERS